MSSYEMDHIDRVNNKSQFKRTKSGVNRKKSEQLNLKKLNKFGIDPKRKVSTNFDQMKSLSLNINTNKMKNTITKMVDDED